MTDPVEPPERPYTTQEVVEGIFVIGFADLGPGDTEPDATYDQDLAEFKGR
jgi:hypothetical protein